MVFRACTLDTGGIMQVTEIRIRKVGGEGKLKAYVTVTFDNCFVVHNVKIIEGKTGVFIAMPSRKTASGEYKDVAHPISMEFRNELQEKIVSEYDAGHFEEVVVGSEE
jgi:stage V sporulation protein G